MIKGLKYMVYLKRLIGPVQLKEKGSCCLQLSKGEVDHGCRLFLKVFGDRTGANRQKLQEKFQLDGRKTLSP